MEHSDIHKALNRKRGYNTYNNNNKRRKSEQGYFTTQNQVQFSNLEQIGEGSSKKPIKLKWNYFAKQ